MTASVERVQAEFDRVWPWLEKALKTYGETHTKEHVWQRILDGRAQLWTEKDAAVVSSVEKYDTGMIELHGWLGGGGIDAVKKIVVRMEAWAAEIGAKRVLIVGRKGWKRALPGYREITTMIAKDVG